MTLDCQSLFSAACCGQEINVVEQDVESGLPDCASHLPQIRFVFTGFWSQVSVRSHSHSIVVYVPLFACFFVMICTEISHVTGDVIGLTARRRANASCPAGHFARACFDFSSVAYFYVM